jgi:hypothetical protein
MRRSLPVHRRGFIAATALLLLPQVAGADLLSAAVSPREARQGEILVVRVTVPEAPETLDGSFAGQPLLFVAEQDGTYRALVGIDLAHPPGTYAVTLHWRPPQGHLTRALPVRVRDGAFPLQRLTLPPRMVDPDPADLARIREEQELLEALFTQRATTAHFAGPFVLPVDSTFPAAGTFGRRRILNGQPRSPHTGEDFPAPVGTPVRAANRGRVAYAGEMYFAGKSVVLDHGLGLFTLYYHLDGIAVEADGVVERGHLLGRVGATGRVTGPHLHWGARLGQSRVDPTALLRLWDAPGAR